MARRISIGGTNMGIMDRGIHNFCRLDRSRGWTGTLGEWWSKDVDDKLGYEVCAAFDHVTEARLFCLYATSEEPGEELLLQDVLPFAAKLRVMENLSDFKNSTVHKVFELMEYSKPSQLEKLTMKFFWPGRKWSRECYGNTEAGLMPVLSACCVVGLASAIASGAFSCLKELKFKRLQLSDESMSILANAFQQREASVVPNLRRLSLRYTTIEEMGILSLAKALSSGRLSSLEELDMTYTSLLGSATMLVDALQQGEASVVPNLKKLILGNTDMGYSTMFSLARGIASGRFTSLEKLDVNGNHLSDKSMRVLADASKRMRRVWCPI